MYDGKYKTIVIMGSRFCSPKNPYNIKLCPVRALLHIRERARCCKLSSSSPPAIAKQDCPLYLAKNIEQHLRKVAQVGYDIFDPDKLHRWSAHSIRVAAAVRLHNAGKTGSYIQPRLRWRSMTIMVYLQNTKKISDQQHVN